MRKGPLLLCIRYLHSLKSSGQKDPSLKHVDNGQFVIIKYLVSDALYSPSGIQMPFLGAQFNAINNDIIKATSDIITPFLIALFNITTVGLQG